MRSLLAQKPDMTLKELRAALGLDCSLPAIHYALSDMGRRDDALKKRVFAKKRFPIS